MLTTILAILLPLLALVASVAIAIVTMKRTGNGKKAFRRQFVSLALALLVCFSLVLAVSAADTDDSAPADEAQTAAAGTSEPAAASGAGLAAGLGFIGAALSIGLAALGAGIALSAGAPAAIGAVAEDPKSFGKSMIFVALGEAVAIYGFIIAFLIILQMPDLSALTAL